MEHSLLHAVQLLSIVATLGGALLILVVLNPACCLLGPDPARAALQQRLCDQVGRWVCRSALAGAGAALVDLLVRTAEVRGQTVFGGVDISMAVRLATTTTVGQLLLARTAVLLLAAAAARGAPPYKWQAIGVLGAAAAVCASLVSHAAAQPAGRAGVIAAQIVHIGAAAVWMGVLIHLLLARRTFEAASAPGALALVAEMVRRFSPVALATASLLAGSGVYSFTRFVATPAAVPVSAYGLTLVVKLTLLVPLLAAGFINFRIVRPALLAARSSSAGRDGALPVLQRFGRMLELEVTAGVLVIAVAGILGGISPPGDDGSQRLTPTQVRALLSPDLPTTMIADPATFYDQPMRTIDDLRYSEFTHNWSGVFVVLLGVCWLVQSVGQRVGDTAGRLWPLLLVPFAMFITVASDPEVWILRRITLREALSSPQILEHHIGALMVLVLAWLGWCDLRGPRVNRPLGYALPILMIFGSLLLLGHAHSSLNITDDLGTLINVQHAILGGLGLLAGTTRWLSLRGLVPQRMARATWPALIVAIGLFMAFGYREVL
jgi:putative copper export protein